MESMWKLQHVPQGKNKRIERKEDKEDVGSRAGNSFFFYFVSEKSKRRKGESFYVLQFRCMYLPNVAIPPSPGRLHVTGATQPLQQESQSEPCRECGRSSRAPPATTGTTQQNLRGQEKMIRPNKVCQVFLASPCPSSLAAHPQPSRSAAAKGCCCPTPARLQDLG